MPSTTQRWITVSTTPFKLWRWTRKGPPSLHPYGRSGATPKRYANHDGVCCPHYPGSPSYQKLTQVWFPGVHSNVGGSYADQELADITLAWMMSMLQPLLEMKLDYVLAQHRMNTEYYLDSHQEPRLWSFGEQEPYTAGRSNKLLTKAITRQNIQQRYSRFDQS